MKNSLSMREEDVFEGGHPIWGSEWGGSADAHVGFVACGLGCWVLGLGSGFWVWGLGFGVWDLEFGVWSLGFGV